MHSALCAKMPTWHHSNKFSRISRTVPSKIITALVAKWLMRTPCKGEVSGSIPDVGTIHLFLLLAVYILCSFCCYLDVFIGFLLDVYQGKSKVQGENIQTFSRPLFQKEASKSGGVPSFESFQEENTFWQ